MRIPAAERDGHVLPRDDIAYARLIAQTRMWEIATRRALEAAGLGPGQSVLDVGCGPGDVMRLMAERVGASGRVTGLDIDERLGARALAVLRRNGPDIYRFVGGDANALGEVDGAPFDLVFARLLLCHMAEPLETLRNLWRHVGPGGALLVMDHDCSPVRTMPVRPLFERATRLVLDAFDAAGRHPDIGVRLPGYFVESGIGPCGGCAVAGVLLAGEASVPMLRGLLASLRPVIVAAGLSEPRALHRLDGDLAAAATEPFHMRWPDMVAVWKRKPGRDAALATGPDSTD